MQNSKEHIQNTRTVGYAFPPFFYGLRLRGNWV